MQPRLTASYGDEGVTYRYSGTVNVALPWTPTLLEIKEKIEAVQGRYNYCLLNRYRSGQDSMGMHADNEPEMGNVIGSLSLGATRTFRIKHNKTKETMSFPVGHGTLIIMAGTMQQFWKHEIPKTKATCRRADQPDVPADRGASMNLSVDPNFDVIWEACWQYGSHKARRRLRSQPAS